MLPPIRVWKDTFRANTVTADYQYESDIVGLSNGNFLVVWNDINDSVADGTGYDIVGQIFDPFGEKIGGTLFLNEGYDDTREETTPRVAATDDGGFALTFQWPAAGALEHLYRRFDADGDPVAGFDEWVIQDGAGDPTPRNAQITQRPDGSSVIVYQNDDGTDHDILAKVVSPTGVTSAVITIRGDDNPSDDNSDPANPVLTTLTDGRVIVALREKDSTDYDIEGYILDTDNTVVTGFTVNIDSDEDVDPNVTALADGGWVITWRTGTEIRGRIYASDGSSPAGVLTFSSDTDVKSEARVIGLQEGGFLLAWIDSTDNEISMRAFDDDGNQASAKRDLPWIGAQAYDLETSLTKDGRVLLTWWEYNQAFSNTEIRTAIVDTRDGNFDVDEGISVARINGGQMNGSDGVDLMYGLEGQDHLRGLQGNDKLWGNDNNDELEGGKGNDRLKGEKGNDVLGGDKGNDKLWGAKGRDKIEGDAGKDTAWGGDGDDKIWGGGANDTAYGDAGNDTIWGGSGKDKLFGGSGNDKVYGGSGNDKLKGDAGNDKLWGGGDQDLIRGDGGADTFIYTAASDSRTGASRRDTIFDFTHDVDKLDLSAIDANANIGGNQAFTFIGTANFSGTGQLRAEVQGGDIYLLANISGGSGAEMEIKLENPGTIDTFDFIL